MKASRKGPQWQLPRNSVRQRRDSWLCRMTQALSPEEEVPKISPTMRMDDIERIVALGRCLIGSINLDLHLESISAGQAAFGNAKSTPWIRVSLDEGSSRYVKVDKQAGRSQATPPAEEICDLTVNQNAKPATHLHGDAVHSFRRFAPPGSDRGGRAANTRLGHHP